MTTDELLAYITDGKAQLLAAQLAIWLTASKRFRVFVEEYRDKIRKKLRGIRDEEGLRDLAVELATAYLLLNERRFTLTYEPYRAIKQRGADFTVVFKTNLPFNVEVKRLRLVDPNRLPEPMRYLDVICDKVDQMAPRLINLLLIWIDTTSFTGAELIIATLNLRARFERKDDAFFVRRGFRDAGEFIRHYRQLSGILLRSTRLDLPSPTNILWTNPLADHPLPREISTIFEHWHHSTSA